MNAQLKKYTDYIKNTGGVTPEQFDEDWEPIGPMVRADLYDAKLVKTQNGKLEVIEDKNAAA